MKKYILFSLSLLALAFSGCEEVIDYELRTADTKLVVEGLVTDQPGPYTVRLSNTKGYLDEGRTPGVSGAEVVITDNHGQADVLQEIGDGVYRTTTLAGVPGRTYYLKAVVKGKEYTAQSYMPAINPIDSLTFEFKKSMNKDDEGYRPSIHFKEQPGKGNYYRFNVIVNGTVDPDELAAISDEIYDGRYAHADMGFALKKGDHLKVELYAIDKPAYEFWFALMNQQNATGGPFDSTPANAPSNISNGAIGFFGASAVTSIEAKVK